MDFLMRFPFKSIFADPFEDENEYFYGSHSTINEGEEDSCSEMNMKEEDRMQICDDEGRVPIAMSNLFHSISCGFVASIGNLEQNALDEENSYGPLEIEEILRIQLPRNDKTVDQYIVSNESEVKFHSEAPRRILSALNFPASAFDGFAPYNRDCNFPASAFDGFAPYNRDCIDVSSCVHDMHYECPDRYLPFRGKDITTRKSLEECLLLIEILGGHSQCSQCLHKFNFSVNDIVETLTVIVPFDIVVEFFGM